MNQLKSRKGFVARHPLFFFIVIPTMFLVGIVVVSGISEIILDHAVLGRAANGMPRLYTMPWLRDLIAGWNLALVYMVPILIALTIWKTGNVRQVAPMWLMVGSAIVCVLGGFHYIEAAWTGVRGTSTLRMGPVNNMAVGTIRALANLTIFAGAAWVMDRRERMA